jgi:hypothetical protein
MPLGRVTRWLLIGLVVFYFLAELVDIFQGLYEMAEFDRKIRTNTKSNTQSRTSKATPNPGGFSSLSSDRNKQSASGNAAKTHNSREPTSKERFATSQAFLFAIDNQDLQSVKTLLKSPNLDPNHENEDGTALFRLCNKQNGDAKVTLDLLEAILTHPQISVNGNERSWSPLKLALANQNKEQVKILMKHPRLQPFVIAKGLSCHILADAPRRIVFVYSQDDPDCFKKHPGAMSYSFYVQKHKQSGGVSEDSTTEQPATAPKQGSGTKPSAKAGRQSSSTSSSTVGEFSPDSIVMNPTRYSSVTEALWTYLFGNRITTKMFYGYVACIASGGVLTSVTILLTLAARKRDEDVAAAPEPPQPQQNNDAAAPANGGAGAQNEGEQPAAAGAE